MKPQREGTPAGPLSIPAVAIPVMVTVDQLVFLSSTEALLLEPLCISTLVKSAPVNVAPVKSTALKTPPLTEALVRFTPAIQL